MAIIRGLHAELITKQFKNALAVNSVNFKIHKGKIIGLSKVPRIVDMYGRRLQVQERMTHQIAESLNDVLSPKGVAVVLEGEHMCMQMRGVEKQNSYATTSSMLGLFRQDARTREEFLNIISMKK